MENTNEKNGYFSEDEYKLNSRNYYLEPEKEMPKEQEIISTNNFENQEEIHEEQEINIENKKKEIEVIEEKDEEKNKEINEKNKENEEKENISTTNNDDSNSLEDELKKQMNNREIIEKKNEEKNFENSLQTHDKLKSYLINICVKIEKGFDLIYYPHERESSSVANISVKTNPFHSINSQILNGNFIKINNTPIQEKENISQKDFQKNLNYLKEKIKEMRSELDIALTMNKIIDYESLLKEKELIFQELKKENLALNIIKENQIEKIEEYNQKVYHREEINTINEKILSLKEEIKKQKDTLKESEERAKDQTKEIISIQNKIKLIKENIEYKKKQKVKDIENKDEDKTENTSDLHLDDMKKEYEDKHNDFLIKEQEYKIIIKEQEIEKQRLKQEIDKLNENIKQSKHNLFLSEKKRKDYSYDLGIIKKAILQKKDEIKKKKSPSKNKLLGKNTHSAINILSKNKQFKKNYVPFNMNNKRIITKPFNINKFMDKVEKHSRNSNNLTKNPTLKLIESLKFDIQSVMNKDKIISERNFKFKKGISNTEKNYKNNIKEDIYLNDED